MSPANNDALPEGFTLDPEHQTAGAAGAAHALPVDATHGIIQRPGATPADYAPPPDPDALPAGFVQDKAPHYQTPDEVASAFNYKDSGFNQIVPERVARTLVKAAATTSDAYKAFADTAYDKALFFMSQHMRNKLETWHPGIGTAEWENAANQYEADRQGTTAAHPNFADAGTGLATAGFAAAGAAGAQAGVLPKAYQLGKVAATMAGPLITKAATTMAMQALKGAGFGLGAGLVYHYRKALAEALGED